VVGTEDGVVWEDGAGTTIKGEIGLDRGAPGSMVDWEERGDDAGRDLPPPRLFRPPPVPLPAARVAIGLSIPKPLPSRLNSSFHASPSSSANRSDSDGSSSAGEGGRRSKVNWAVSRGLERRVEVGVERRLGLRFGLGLGEVVVLVIELGEEAAAVEREETWRGREEMGLVGVVEVDGLFWKWWV
jgi:hypothetical protein